MIVQAQTYGLAPRQTEQLSGLLSKGLVGIIPTDSVYAFCCLTDQRAAFEQICFFKKLEPKLALMSILCKDLSQASDYFVQWSGQTFRILNKNLPGPFTFILESGHRAPAFLKNKRKTLGLRISNHPVVSALMQEINAPLLVSSVIQDDEAEEYFQDGDALIKYYQKQVGFIVIEEETDTPHPSTVVDLTGDEPVIIRQGKGLLRE